VLSKAEHLLSEQGWLISKQGLPGHPRIWMLYHSDWQYNGKHESAKKLQVCPL